MPDMGKSINYDSDVRIGTTNGGRSCLALAAWILLVGKTGGTVAPAITIAVLGIWGVAMARKR